MKKVRSREERMRERGAKLFTGREEQIRAFELALNAAKNLFEPPFKDTKTVIAISGEGGMGKTTLLWEFERICRRWQIQSIYLDMRRKEEPHGIIDVIKALRP